MDGSGVCTRGIYVPILEGMAPHRAPIQTPPSVPADGGASRARARGLDRVASAAGPRAGVPGRVSVPAGVVRAALANLLLSVALLAWLLPSPWGMLVPVAVLAQAAAWRQGAARTGAALALGGAAGAAMGPLLGLGDWRRSAMALLLVVLAALVAWPARAPSARR